MTTVSHQTQIWFLVPGGVSFAQSSSGCVAASPQPFGMIGSLKQLISVSRGVSSYKVQGVH